MATERLNTWRLRELVDEPLYCAVPKPEHDNDFVCYDSDEQLSDSARLAKRLRYEAAGRRYLDGHRPRLISASLRGPFDASSGWMNPWLPKASRSGARCAAKPLSDLDSQYRAASHGRITTLTQDANFNLSAVNTCPNSSSWRGNEPLSTYPDRFLTETPNVHLHIEKKTRIQAWAESVELGLPDDDKDFWNPQAKPVVQDESSMQMASDTARNTSWLKKTPLKRKRSGKLSATSPQAAKKPVTLNRSVSDSAAVHHKPPVSFGVLRKEASSILFNQSFELTPSSSADPLPSGHLREQLAPVSESDYPSTAGDTICPRIRNRETRTGPDPSGLNQTRDIAWATTNVEDCQASPEDPMGDDINESNDDANAQAVPVAHDESNFRYRNQRQESGSMEANRVDRRINTQNLTQTETPESSHHPDESIKPADPVQTSPLEQVVADIANNVELEDCEPVATASEHNKSSKSSDDNNERVAPSPGVPDEVDAPPELINTIQNILKSAAGDDEAANLPNHATEVLQQDVQMQEHDHTAVVDKGTTEACVDIVADVTEEPAGPAHIENFDLQTLASGAIQLSQSEELPKPEAAHLPNKIIPSKTSVSPVVQDYDRPANVQPDIACAQSSDFQAQPKPLASLLNLVDVADEERKVSEEMTASEKTTSPQQIDARPAPQQSPWIADDLQAPLASTLLAGFEEVESPTPHQRSSPLTDAVDIELGIESQRDSLNFGIQLKSFSHFNTSPPRSQRIKKPRSRNSTGQLSSILSTKSSPSTWGRKSLVNDSHRRASHGVRRRVTFAPLPSSVGDESDTPDHSHSAVRAASPPPAVSFSAADEDVTDQFHKHFESVKWNRSDRRRTSQPLVHASAENQTRMELMETAQQPELEMEEDNETPTACLEVQTQETPSTPSREPTKDSLQQSSPSGLQSPWRADTQTDQMDDVAAVMGNLDAFLDAWDVDAEMQRASQGMETDKENQSQEKTKDRLSGNRFGLQELSIWN